MDIIVLKPGITKKEIKGIEKKLKGYGLSANVTIKGTERTIIGVKGDTSSVLPEQEDSIRALDGVEKVMRIIQPYKLASRESHEANSVINVRGKKIGGKRIHVIAGPCAVEGSDIVMDIARKVSKAGASAADPVPGRGVRGWKLAKTIPSSLTFRRRWANSSSPQSGDRMMAA